MHNIRLHSMFHPENGTDYLMLKVELIKEEFDENMKNKGSKEFQDMAERITTQVSASRVALILIFLLSPERGIFYCSVLGSSSPPV